MNYIFFLIPAAFLAVIVFLVVDLGRRLARLRRDSDERLEELQRRLWQAEELGQKIEQDLRHASDHRETADTEASTLRERFTDLQQATDKTQQELRAGSDQIQAQESATRSRVDQLDRRVLATRRSLFTITRLLAESELLVTDTNPDTARLRELVVSLERQLLELKSQVESFAADES